jgi:hypothetical protein
MSRKWMVVSVATAVAAGVMGVGAAAGRRAVEADPPSQHDRPSSPAAADGFVEYRNDAAGFTLSYPSSWTRLEPGDPQVGLLVSLRLRGSLLVRVVQLPQRVGQGDLESVRALTDKVVSSGAGLEVLSGPRQIEVGGLPGLYYLYRFVDGGTGQRGAHSHFFLFKDDQMISLVLQALPDDEFAGLAPTFDQIVGTFKVL